MLAVMELAGGEVAADAKVEVAPLTESLRSHPVIRYISTSIQFHETGDQDGHPVIPRVDTAPHGLNTPTQATPLFFGVREASGSHPMGVRRSASSSPVIKYWTATCF